MKKLKRVIPGCAALVAALFLCIPAMAGGYSATSELKVNIIGICSWPEEAEGMHESLLFSEDESQATPSNASKSNALKNSIDDDNGILHDVFLPNASLSDAKLHKNKDKETEAMEDKINLNLVLEPGEKKDVDFDWDEEKDRIDVDDIEQDKATNVKINEVPDDISTPSNGRKIR